MPFYDQSARGIPMAERKCLGSVWSFFFSLSQVLWANFRETFFSLDSAKGNTHQAGSSNSFSTKKKAYSRGFCTIRRKMRQLVVLLSFSCESNYSHAISLLIKRQFFILEMYKI